MLETVVTRLRSQSSATVDTLYWFVALLSLLPAIRADLLFPFLWSSVISGKSAAPLVDNPYGLWAFALVIVAAILVKVSSNLWRLLPPLALLLLAVLNIGPQDSEVGQHLPMLNTVYIAVAFLGFVYFIVAGRVLSLSFFAFVLLLVAIQQVDNQLAWPQVLVFIAVSLVTSLVYETFRQNWPLAKQLGRNNLFGLLGKTLLLWWPMVFLIGAGIWLSNTLTDATEEAIYASGSVDRYCYLDEIGSEATFACPDWILTQPTTRAQAEENPELPLVDSLSVANDRIENHYENDVRSCMIWPRVYTEADRPPEPVPNTFDCPEADPAPDFWPVTRLDFFDSLDLTVARLFQIRRWQLDNRMAYLRESALTAKDGADTEARKLYALVPEETGMQTSSCGVLKVSCHAANIVITELNDAYEVARDDGEEEFVRYVDDKVTDGYEDFEIVREEIHTEMAGVLNAWERRTRATIGRVHTASNIVRQVLWLWLIVVTLKSILFVFARVIFDRSTDIEVDLLEHDGPARQGSIRLLQEVDIGADYPHTLYYKANYQPLGPAPRFTIPQWRASMLSRLRFGAWNMSQVRMPMEDDNSITFNSIEGEHLVDWQLEEGEEVIFSYRNFVAMNEHIELRTVVSLRVATLLMGRFIFHTARAKNSDGRLLLRTRGKPATAKQVRQSIPVARLVAWNRYARFSVDSHLTTADIFLNGFNLRRSSADDSGEAEGILVVEADARDGGILVGTLRFARNFLLPV